MKSQNLIQLSWQPFIAKILSIISEELFKFLFTVLFLSIWPLYDRDIITIGVAIGIGFSLRNSIMVALDPAIVLGSLGAILIHFLTGGLHGLGLYMNYRGKAYWVAFSLMAIIVHILFNLQLFF